MNAENVISLAAALVSLIALVFSWISYNNSNLQFLIINQSYLQADMTTNGLTIENNDKVVEGVVATEDLEIQGLNCAIVLTNIGNLPLKYRVKKYDVFFNSQLKNSVDSEEDNNIGVLYPKQLLNFYMKTTPFKENGESIQFRYVKQMEITAWVIIEYNDLNNSHIKTIERKLKFILHDNIFETRYLTFDDKV